MTAIIIPNKTKTQPQGRFSLSSEWASAGVRFADIPSRTIKMNQSHDVFSRVLSPHGEAFRIPNGIGRVEAVYPEGASFSLDFTWFLLLERTFGTGSGWPPVLTCRQGDVSSTLRGGFGFWSNTGNLYFFYRNSADTAYFDSTTITTPLNTKMFVVATRRGSTFKLFSNGSLIEEKTAIEGVAITNGVFFYGNLSDVTSNPSPQSNIYMSGVAEEGFDDAQILSLSENPYQIFRVEPTRIYSFPTTGIPTLSLPGVIDITATSARPQVTVTY